MRTMYDSVAPAAIPHDAQMVAGYVDGRYAWSAEDWARFPDAVRVTISAIGVRLAQVFDVEAGCIWPPERVVPLVVRAREAGIDPTVYCNWQNDLPGVKAAFIRADVPEPHYWVAKYDGIAEVPAGTVGKQYKAPEAPGRARAGGHYDVSAVADYWPGVDETKEDDFLMGLPQWQQERLYDRVLAMAAGVEGQNYDGRQFAWEKAQNTALHAKLDAMGAAIKQLHDDPGTPVNLTPEQLDALSRSAADAAREGAQEAAEAFEAGLESLKALIRDTDTNDEDQLDAALRRFYGRATSEV